MNQFTTNGWIKSGPSKNVNHEMDIPLDGKGWLPHLCRSRNTATKIEVHIWHEDGVEEVYHIRRKP